MGFLDRRALALGWQPDVDAAAAPAGALLRADNLTLEERGVLARRRGSTRVYGVADAIVHSMHTEYLNGVRYRMVGAGNAVYANGGLVLGHLDGTGDISFGAHLGQILFARGTVRQKLDASALRNWGIPMTGAAPTGTPGPPDGKTLVTGSATSVPAFVITEDDGTGLSYMPGHNGVVNAATVVKPSTTTGRGILTATRAAPGDFTVYDNDTEADDADLISCYVYVTEPTHVASIQVLVDVNDGGFQTDYYLAEFATAQTQVVGPTDTQNADFGTDPATPTPVSPATPGNLVSVLLSVGWNKLQITRGQMQRVGATNGLDWSTVKAMRVIVNAYSNDAVGIDSIRIEGGRLTGQYTWCYVLAYHNDEYIGLSAPSPISDVVTLASSGARVLVPLDGLRDTQADEVWLYRKGGALADFLRVAVKPIGSTASDPALFSITQFWEAEFLSHLLDWNDNGVANYVVDFEGTDFGRTFAAETQFGPGVYTNGFELDTGLVAKAGMSATRTVTTGALAIDDTLSDVNALIANEQLEPDNDRPPANIIDIEGPWFDRIWVLTSDGMLAPSRQNNPDSFATGQQLRVSAPDEQAFWVKKGSGGLYIGTNKDIYRIEGDGTELPDGTINVTKRPINVDHPPVADGVAQDGNLLVYIANDGWRAFTGETTQSLVEATSLLYRGYTRHGVSPINLATGRFRAAVAKGRFTALAPEGSSSTATAVLYRRQPTGAWERHVFTPTFGVIYAERDGTLLAGDTAGNIWALDTDATDAIPITLWTPADDGGNPFVQKGAVDLHLTFDSGGTTLTILAVRDGQLDGGVPFSASRTGLNLTVLDISTLQDFRQLQLQVTGTVATFRWAGYGLTVLPRPTGVTRWDTGPVDVQKGELAWVRRLFVKVRPSGPITVAVTMDGAIVHAKTYPASGGQDLQLPIDFPRGVLGRQVRFVLTSTNPFQPYWAQVQLRSTGKGSQKPIVTVSA